MIGLRGANKLQWLVHASISGAWAFVGAQVMWLGSPVFAGFLSAFYAGVVGATMKEATDQTVYDALWIAARSHDHNKTLGAAGHLESLCDHLNWHGWDWLDWAQHVTGAFLGAWAGIAFYFMIS